MARDDAEFSAFVRSRSPALLRTAFLLVGDRARAEDLLQTALVKTYLRWNRIREPEAVEAYVRRVLVTTAASWWRRPSARERLIAEPPDRATDDHSTTHAESEAIHRLLLSLPGKQRAALVLRFYHDLPEAEIADILGISRGTVSRYLTRGLGTLRAKLTTEAAR